MQMNPNFALLSDLHHGTNWITIKVRAGSMWNSVNQKTNEKFAINLQLLDDAGNQKQGTIRRHILQVFEDTFEEHGVYQINRFNVQDSDTFHRAIDEDWLIGI